ncbi:MAG: TetR/AcrR family transcriptional regulator [Actinomycetota bacterium]|nr:TetR/AcrR family transcriptional regulator [Actinomycetota bacterium]
MGARSGARTQQPTAQPEARRRLVEAAMRSFAARGYHATTTRDIAAGAGMSPAAVYVHHSSKEELLFLISRDGHDAALRVVTAAAADHADDPAARLAACVRAFTRWHAEHHTLARVVQYEGSALAPAHWEQIVRRRRAIEQVVRDTIGAGVDRGVFAAIDVPGTAMAILSLAVDVARWYREDGRRTADAIAELYADLALRMVGHHDGREHIRRR